MHAFFLPIPPFACRFSLENGPISLDTVLGESDVYRDLPNRTYPMSELTKVDCMKRREILFKTKVSACKRSHTRLAPIQGSLMNRAMNLDGST